MTPLLKWPGGKRLLAERIRRVFDGPVPLNGWYIEPFAGSLSVYLHRYSLGEVQPVRAILADNNPRLMAFYRGLRRQPDYLAEVLAELPSGEGWKAAFAGLRADLNARQITPVETGSPQFCAQYLWYNHACFNGLMRVNGSGALNAPAGSYETLTLPSLAEIQAVAKALLEAVLLTTPFSGLLPRQNAQIYCDPPYAGGWVGYTKEGFSYRDQLELALWADRTRQQNNTVVVSNADCLEIRALYPGLGFEVRELQAARSISCTIPGREPAAELLLVGRPCA